LREIREETGVEAEIAGLVDIHEVIRRDIQGAIEAHYLLAVYFGRWIGGEPSPGGDAAAACFVPIGTLADLPMTDGATALIERAHRLLATVV
jgi:8-oxo-dGTP diphosphatase